MMKVNRIKLVALVFLLCFGLVSQAQNNKAVLVNSHFNGTLRLNPNNPRYFTDNNGNAIFLTGSHTWANFQEFGVIDQENFDWKGYLEMMKDNDHNFMRLWVWEQCWGAAWTVDSVFVNPLPYLRTGIEPAKDGKPKFDLTKWNQIYFDRLRERVIEAGNNGIYVSVMLFQGWSLNRGGTEKNDPYLGHPFNIINNINGVNIPNAHGSDDSIPSFHSLILPEINSFQKAYVKKVIETVNDLDNVLYEIINEGGGFAWQQYLVSYIKKVESDLPKQHPVGITHRIAPFLLNADLFKSNADWVSPANEPQGWVLPGGNLIHDYGENPPANQSDKVVILDTDHIWGHGGNYKWAWKAFCRGYNPIFMDPWQHLPGNLDKERMTWMFISGGICKDTRDFPDWQLLRENMGVIRKLADNCNLNNMIPSDQLSSTGFCIAEPGKEYVIYFPSGGTATINLAHSTTEYNVKWYIPVLHKWIEGGESIQGGSFVSLTAPFTGDVVLVLKTK